MKNLLANSQSTAALLMLSAALPLALGIYLFISRGGLQGGAPRTAISHAVERGSIVAAVLLTTLGLLALAESLRGADGHLWANLGGATILIGAVLLVTAELMGLGEAPAHYALIVAYVVLALIGQAAVGAGLLQSGALPAGIGWAVIAWNLGWLLILPLATPKDMYFPILHHLMPFLIGAYLLWRA